MLSLNFFGNGTTLPQKIGLFKEHKHARISRMETPKRNTNQLFIAILTVLLAVMGYLYYEYYNQNQKINMLREEDRNEEFEDQIREISGTVGVLDKLSKTDEELLQKYSRTYFLNENFVPMKIRQIEEKYILPGKKDQYFHGDAIGFLTDLLDAAKRAGHDLKVISAYRSFDEQADLKGQYTQVYGTGSNAFSADQGYSEHQLGTTLDLTDPVTGGTYTSFAQTEAYAWLIENAHRYGFILSYPEGNGFYIFEPWHWRFVGVDLASDLHRQDKSFYDLDQRELDKYLITIFD